MHYKNGREAMPNLNECYRLDDVLKALPAIIPDATKEP